VEWLKVKALSSNPSTAKKIKKEKNMQCGQRLRRPLLGLAGLMDGLERFKTGSWVHPKEPKSRQEIQNCVIYHWS
jgi:hypothetical protein